MTEFRRDSQGNGVSQENRASSGAARTGRRHAPRLIAAAGAAVIGLTTVGTGNAGAVVNTMSSITDGQDNLLEVSLGDTSIVGVPPLDSSPLSREFFHSGYAEARISGPTAAATSGTLSFGYQVGYPISLTGGTIQLNTPSLGWELESKAGLDLGGLISGNPDATLGVEGRGMLAGDIIPQQNLTFDLQPGGITDVPVVQGKAFSGAGAKIRIGNIHGSVSGAIGPVTLRPYARLETASGDIVMTYGAPVPV